MMRAIFSLSPCWSARPREGWQMDSWRSVFRKGSAWLDNRCLHMEDHHTHAHTDWRLWHLANSFFQPDSRWGSAVTFHLGYLRDPAYISIATTLITTTLNTLQKKPDLMSHPIENCRLWYLFYYYYFFW
jgi:hypothetical protein